jgi:hypothetical protein
MNNYDFEIISDMFHRNFKISPISHCDKLIFDKNKILLIEETVYINKDLLNSNNYNKEFAEIVKKMWGSFSILLWYIDNKKLFKKDKIFILKAKIDKRFIKILSKLIRDLKKYKNGAYTEVKFIEV